MPAWAGGRGPLAFTAAIIVAELYGGFVVAGIVLIRRRRDRSGDRLGLVALAMCLILLEVGLSEERERAQQAPGAD